MEPFLVVEQLDIPEIGLPHVFDVLEVTPVGLLLLEACEGVSNDYQFLNLSIFHATYLQLCSFYASIKI